MEFLKALNEAKMHGLTKEEFIPMWELEAKTRQMAEEAKLMNMRQTQEAEPMTNSFRHLVSQIESHFNHNRLQLQDLRNQLNQLEEIIQVFNNKFNSNVEEQRKQFQQEAATLKDELCQQLKNLNDGVSQLGSFLQVLDENVGKSSVSPNQYSAGTSYEESTDFKHSTFKNGFQPPRPHGQQDQVGERQGIDLAEKSNEEKWNLVGQKEKQVKQKTYSSDAGASAAATFKDQSIVGTGHIAEAISRMMEKNGNNEEWFRPNKVEIIGSFPSENGDFDALNSRSKDGRRKNQEIVSAGPSITYIPDRGAEFCISINRKFKVLGEDFFTDFFYTRPRACKVRFRLGFNKSGRLGVNLLVSEGVFDDRHKWPMVFNGHGEIFNQGSQTYTKLWTIESQECPMPTNKRDETLGASVCLSTSREPTEDVTLDLLTRKRYVADGDRLLFRWHLKAMDKMDVHGSFKTGYPIIGFI